ncbi:MAG: hypothetical protein JSW07_04950, partial [bacterium]
MLEFLYLYYYTYLTMWKLSFLSLKPNSGGLTTWAFCVGLAIFVSVANPATIKYTASSDLVDNPERGFYVQ